MKKSSITRNPKLQEEILDVVRKDQELLKQVGLASEKEVEPAQENSKITVASVDITEGRVELQEPAALQGLPDADVDKLLAERDPAAAAGALFALYGTRLYEFVDKMNKKQLKRLVKALCTYPLEDVFVNKKIPLEMNTYHIATKMIESRFLLTMHAAYEQEEKRKQFVAERDAAKTESTQTNEIPESETKST